MKLFAAAFLLPLVFGCPEMQYTPCGGYELWCDNAFDADGCWMGNWCLETDPAAPCPIFCPMVCYPGEISCPQAPDFASGCPHPDLCVPAEGKFYLIQILSYLKFI